MIEQFLILFEMLEKDEIIDINEFKKLELEEQESLLYGWKYGGK